MGIKTELWEVHKRLERIEGELSSLRAVLNEHFSIDEQAILRYEASTGKDSTRLEGSRGIEIEQYASACRQYLKFGEEVDACLAGELPRQTAVRVGMSPPVLEHLGCGKEICI